MPGPAGWCWQSNRSCLPLHATLGSKGCVLGPPPGKEASRGRGQRGMGSQKAFCFSRRNCSCRPEVMMQSYRGVGWIYDSTQPLVETLSGAIHFQVPSIRGPWGPGAHPPHSLPPRTLLASPQLPPCTNECGAPGVQASSTATHSSPTSLTIPRPGPPAHYTIALSPRGSHRGVAWTHGPSLPQEANLLLGQVQAQGTS